MPPTSDRLEALFDLTQKGFERVEDQLAEREKDFHDLKVTMQGVAATVARLARVIDGDAGQRALPERTAILEQRLEVLEKDAETARGKWWQVALSIISAVLSVVGAVVAGVLAAAGR